MPVPRIWRSTHERRPHDGAAVVCRTKVCPVSATWRRSADVLHRLVQRKGAVLGLLFLAGSGLALTLFVELFALQGDRMGGNLHRIAFAHGNSWSKRAADA